MFSDQEEVIVLRGEHKGRIGTVTLSELSETYVFFDEDGDVWDCEVLRFPTSDLMATDTYAERMESGELAGIN